MIVTQFRGTRHGFRLLDIAVWSGRILDDLTLPAKNLVSSILWLDERFGC